MGYLDLPNAQATQLEPENDKQVQNNAGRLRSRRDVLRLAHLPFGWITCKRRQAHKLEWAALGLPERKM